MFWIKDNKKLKTGILIQIKLLFLLFFFIKSLNFKS